MHIEGGTSAAFRREIEAAPDPDEKRRELEAQFQALSSPFRTAEATGLDLIDPRETRAILCDFVELAQNVIKTQLGPGSGPTPWPDRIRAGQWNSCPLPSCRSRFRFR